MTTATKGILAMVTTCVVWGLSPIFYALIRDVPPLEVLSYRTLWALVFFALVLAFQRRLSLVPRALSSWRKVAVIGAAALMISANWFGFIYAVQAGRTMETSLGYYIFPLVAVLLGRVMFSERLPVTQWIAVGLAACAVALLTYGLGVPPYIALGLAASFGLYGAMKKRLDLGPVVSVTAEMVLLAPIAVLLIAWQVQVGEGGHDLRTHLLLALSGPLTAVPLIMFSYAARRVKLATVGLVQYINPTLQFLCAVLVFAEPFTFWHGVAFPLIWLALAIYTATAVRQERASRKIVSNAATSGAVEI